MYTYAHAPSMKRPYFLLAFPLEINSKLLFEDSMVSKVSQIFSPNKCTHFFQKLIDQGFALVYIDNILLLAHIKIHMLDLIEQLHQISSSNILKISPEKSFCYLLTVKFLGLAIGNKTIKPISSKFDGIHKLETPTSRTELMRFIGSLKFYSNFMNKLHLSLEPFCTPPSLLYIL